MDIQKFCNQRIHLSSRSVKYVNIQKQKESEVKSMGIFSGLFKSRDKPQNRTSGSGYSFFFGGTTSGKTVTERSAMQMTAVYSCVRILSEAVAGLPLHLYKYTDSGGKAMAHDRCIGYSTMSRTRR
jgi:hypothetical protein